MILGSVKTIFEEGIRKKKWTGNQTNQLLTPCRWWGIKPKIKR